MSIYYFDNSATTLRKPQAVIDAMTDALAGQKYANPARGGHDLALNAMRAVQQVRLDLLKLFQALDDYTVSFAANATQALNFAIKGLLKPGDHVISTSWEHNSVIRPLKQLEAQGVTTDYLPSDPVTGRLQIELLEELLTDSTAAVVCNHASNVTGNLLPLEEIKDFCHQHDLMLIVDGSQSAGIVPIDLSDGIVTAFCFTGHKSLYGPEGTGGLCLRRDLTIEPLITGGDGMHSFSPTQPQELPGVLEAGTQNVPGIVGLGAGVQELLTKDQTQIWQQMQAQTKQLAQALDSLPNVTVYGQHDSHQATLPVLSFNIQGISSSEVADLLWSEYQVAVRSGYHCAPKMHTDLGTKDTGTVRISLSVWTTESELKVLIEAVQTIAKQAMSL